MNEHKKILIIALPFFGHLNPITGIVYELASNNNLKVIFYGCEEVRELIERTNSEYRSYNSCFSMEKFKRKPTNVKQDSAVIHTLIELMNVCHKLLPELIEIIEKEKPDLIMYDMWALHTKYALKIIENNYKNKLSTLKPPASVLFTPFFAFSDQIYPDKSEYRMMIKFDFNYIIKLLVIFYKQLILNFKFGLRVFNPLKLFFMPNEDLNIVAVFPELQPRANLFDQTFKFVGCCVSENVRNLTFSNDKLKSFLNLFDSVNPIKRQNNRFKLIYASLGTIFNNNMYIYEHIINSIKTFEHEDSSTNSGIKSTDLRLIISVGQEVYNKYQDKINNENYDLPDNIILLPVAPQIEILKRASLFITHSGMNSTSEAIHYGVSMICIPIQVDQPLVAHRICHELKLGKQFDYKKLTCENLRQAMHEIFLDKSYQERTLEFGKISRKYNGPKIAANFIIDFMKNIHSFDKKQK